MTTFADLEGLVREQLDSFGVNPGPMSFLTNDLYPSDTSMSIATPHSGGISAGVVEVGKEQIYVIQHDTTNPGGQNTAILPGGRGWNGTRQFIDQDNPVPAGTLVRIRPSWTAKQIRTALLSTFPRVYPTLFGIKQYTFDFDSSKWQYDLPAEVERVLNVRTQSTAAHQPWIELNRWRFSTVTDPAMPNSITFEDYAQPGQPVIVSYATRPTVDPDSGVDVWEQTGLNESLLQGILCGAVAYLLKFADAARVLLGTTQLNIAADNPDQRVGTAMSLSTQLEQMFQLEVQQEARRQRQTWKPVINTTRGN